MQKEKICPHCDRSDGTHDNASHNEAIRRAGIRLEVWDGYVARARLALANGISREDIIAQFADEGQTWRGSRFVWEAQR